MSRLHDMGGRYGDGPIPVSRNKNNQVENNEPTFKSVSYTHLTLPTTD